MNKTQAPSPRRIALFAEVDLKLHREVRIQAAREGRPIARLIEEAVRTYLREAKTSA